MEDAQKLVSVLSLSPLWRVRCGEDVSTPRQQFPPSPTSEWEHWVGGRGEGGRGLR